jgi:hypothetical protein
MTGFEPSLPPRATRGEVSAQRTEGSWAGRWSIESSVQFGSLQRLIDSCEYDIGPSQHVVVPEAQHPKAARSEKHVSTDIVVGLLGMLAAVQLDDEKSFETREIADVRAHRVLPTKFEACQLTSAHTLPKHALRTSRVLAEGARKSKHAATEPRTAVISVAGYNLNGQRLMTPPALRATSPALLGRQAVVAP